MAKNKVYINENDVVEIIVRGNQTVDSVQQMGDEALHLSLQQRSAGRPALLLDNLLEMGEVPKEARKLVVDLIKSNDYDRLAMLGSNPMIRFGANLMLQATGKGSRVKYFEDYAVAVAWLKANDIT